MCVIKQNASKTHAEKSRAKKGMPKKSYRKVMPNNLCQVNWSRALTDVVKQKLDEKLGGTNWTP